MFSLKDITVGHYVNTRSVVHRLDPRTKCAAVILLMAAVIVAKSAYFYILVTVGCFALTLIAELPWAMVVRNLRAFIWLFAITFGIHLFFTPGTPLTPFPIKGVTITSEGLERGIFFSYRLALLIVSAALFTLTTSPTELTDGIERMLKPLRRLGLPVHELAMTMTIALRFIPTLVEEADRLRKAQLARGAHFSGGPVRRARALIPLMLPLLLSAFRRADELAAAMDARCYRGGKGRTHFRELKLARWDYLALAATGAVCVSGLVVT